MGASCTGRSTGGGAGATFQRPHRQIRNDTRHVQMVVWTTSTARTPSRMPTPPEMTAAPSGTGAPHTPVSERQALALVDSARAQGETCNPLLAAS